MKMLAAFISLGAGLSFGVLALGCSTDASDTATDTSYTCPAVGTKRCPNDEAVSQGDHDGCNRCKPELAALEGCSGPITCNDKGKSSSVDANKCASQTFALLNCATK